MEIEEQYKLLTEHQKILKRPQRYLGQTDLFIDERFMFSEESKKMELRMVEYSPALLKMFDEIISNSVDASKRKELKHLNTIKVNIDKLSGTITIEDNGGIPVVIHKEHGVHVPELIFGNLHAGENFNDDVDSTVAGSNGEGSSLANIFSVAFKVTTMDGSNMFSKQWRENMFKSDKCKVVASKKKGTIIEYTPDYERLDTGILEHNNFDVARQRTIDVAACNPNIKVYFNDELIKIKSFKDYVAMFQDDFIYIENNEWKVGIAASESGTTEHVSFVNATHTSKGGTHVQYIADQLVDDIRAHIKKKYKYDVKPAEIKNHFRLFIDATIVKPRYDSQTKENLSTLPKIYGTSINIDEKTISKLLKSEVLVNLIDWLEAKRAVADAKEAKKEGAKNKKTKVDKHLPANHSDVERRILHITEGNSAIANLINVRDPEIHGGYPIKGKFLNSRELADKDLLTKTAKGEFKYNEVAELMSILGLHYDGTMDLKYGTIAVMADADHDGNCIVGLLANFFSRWPQLYHEGRIKMLISPIVIATYKGGRVERFYEMSDFQAADTTGATIEYLKGLGSLSLEEYNKAINDPLYVTLRLTEECEKSLDLVFNKGKNKSSNRNYADERKDWLLEIDEELDK